MTSTRSMPATAARHSLRSGYTTGACAAAAAKGATLMMARQEIVDRVTIDLPAGISATFELHGQSFSAGRSSCFVIKDAGDDPDVTNGAEVWAEVTANPPQPPFSEGGSTIIIDGGTGIGKATKPGLAVAPGEWAINPVPRRMIAQAVQDVLSEFRIQNSKFKIVISIPDGEERARKTLNARLGIIGGLSILGTSGIVRPISAKAWTDTIDTALDVAKACGCSTVVLSTGRTSELAAQKLFFPRPQGEGQGEGGIISSYSVIPEEACIMMGDHIAHAMRACLQRGFDRPLVACQFAKLLKIACGHENTHAAASELDLATLRGWATENDLPAGIISLISTANTAREIIIASSFDRRLLELVVSHARSAAAGHAPGVIPSFLVAGYTGTIVHCSGQ